MSVWIILSATTLSGGEAQRIKLASELNKRATGKTLYLLDEPSVGLHWYDLDKLIKIIQQLADNGNTILIIEHNLDLIKIADYIIDLGLKAVIWAEISLPAEHRKKLPKIQTLIQDNI